MSAIPAATTNTNTRKRPIEVRAWPETTWRRVLLQVLVALPFVVLAFLLGGSYGPQSPNAALLHEVQRLHYADPSLSWIPKLTPIIPAILAAILQLPVLMSVAGAIVTGVFIQTVMELLHQRQVRTWYQILVVALITLNPVFIFQATQNLSIFLGITAFIVALVHMVRFIEWGSTFHGVAAGAVLPIAAFSDRNGFIYPLIMLVIMPVLRWWRKGERGAARATVTVVFFPVIITAVSLAAVNWFVANLNPFMLAVQYLDPHRFDIAGNTARLPVNPLIGFVPPLAILAIATLLARRPLVGLVAAIAIAIELFSIYYGFVDSTRVGLAWFTIVGVYLSFAGIRQAKLRHLLLSMSVVVLLCANAYVIAFSSPTLVRPFIDAFIAVLQGASDLRTSLIS